MGAVTYMVRGMGCPAHVPQPKNKCEYLIRISISTLVILGHSIHMKDTNIHSCVIICKPAVPVSMTLETGRYAFRQPVQKKAKNTVPVPVAQKKQE